MKTVVLRVSTNKLSLDTMWHRVADITTYPQRIKYCHKVWDVDLREGGGYTDLTTIMWVPLTINHHIVEERYHTRIKYSLAHWGGWTSTQTYTFTTDQDITTLEANISFDFGNQVLNNTFGPILKKRIVRMLESGFPELALDRVI